MKLDERHKEAQKAQRFVITFVPLVPLCGYELDRVIDDKYAVGSRRFYDG